MTDEMRQAVMAVIRESLTVTITVNTDWSSFNSNSRRATVGLYLDGERFSEDSYSFDVKED
jgi:hypothetical protein